MSDLSNIEREAKQTRDFIAELKGLTPRFNATKERAEEELKLHLNKIDAKRQKLAQLIDAAALIVQHLGAPVPCPAETELAAVLDEHVLAPAAEAVAVVDDALDEQDQTFESIGVIAAEITAAVEVMAGDQPEHPDATDEPEMTDTQVEKAEEEIAAAPVRELETASGSPRRFNTFASNPFA